MFSKVSSRTPFRQFSIGYIRMAKSSHDLIHTGQGKLRTRLSVEGSVDCPYVGLSLLNIPELNKGTAFSIREREEFGLNGLLPSRVNSLQEQVDRAYKQFKQCPDDLSKNVFCRSMKVQNEVLYYRLIRDHLKEMLRIIYTPTEGEAIEKYSHLFRRPEGCFLDITKPDDIAQRLLQYGNNEDIDYIVVTDAEGILGIGDQGVGGIGISIAKLVLMTVCGGIHPSRVIPVVLDVGTDNENLLKDPLYLGHRMKRVRGEKYDEFVNNFVETVKTLYPKAMLHFEDFGVKNAQRILDKYQDELSCFNDDIQGTGAVTMAVINASLKYLEKDFSQAKTLIFGAGSAGMGIAEQMVEHLVAKGVDIAAARKNIYLVDRPGLLVDSLESTLSPHQKLFMAKADDFKNIDTTKLKEVIGAVQPDILIGCSTRHGAFTQEVCREMAKHVERPIILPLSNPTKLVEAHPADVIEWTNGRALVATGSPFGTVNGRVISENNNCYVFPGIGLGVVLSRASRLTQNMIAAAIDALADQSPLLAGGGDVDGGILPDISQITDISARIATAVVLQAKRDGVATVENERKPESDEHVNIPMDFYECLDWVKVQMWKPIYRPLHKVSDYHHPTSSFH